MVGVSGPGRQGADPGSDLEPPPTVSRVASNIMITLCVLWNMALIKVTSACAANTQLTKPYDKHVRLHLGLKFKPINQSLSRISACFPHAQKWFGVFCFLSLGCLGVAIKKAFDHILFKCAKMLTNIRDGASFSANTSKCLRLHHLHWTVCFHCI